MTEERKRALKNLKTARGQLDGIIRMIEEGRYCIDISNQLLASAALLKKANFHILSGHLHTCVAQAMQEGEQEQKLQEIEALLAKLTK